MMLTDADLIIQIYDDAAKCMMKAAEMTLFYANKIRLLREMACCGSTIHPLLD